MYCRYCGKEVKDKAVVCTGCGHPIEEPGGQVVGYTWNWLTFLGLFFLTLVLGPAGIVFGVIGLRDPGKKVQGAVLLTTGIFMTLLLTAIILGL